MGGTETSGGIPETPHRSKPHSRPPSSRPSSSRRKSQSTSALSTLADGGQGTPAHRPRKSSALPVVDEVKRTSNSQDKAATKQREATVEGAQDALRDLRSLRSSGRRRLLALRDLERFLINGCGGTGLSSADFVAQKVHVALLSLLGRHTASLAKRASSTTLTAGDDLARHLMPEIDASVNILQGLSLLSRSCKEEVGERWAMEMFTDLLLLLRTQPSVGPRPTVYLVLDLLFCILVDSVSHHRTFEDLNGLEAVTRVLRGTGVQKEVRMKCCEFLYFYLLPEGSTTLPDISSSDFPSRSTSMVSLSDASAFQTPDASSASMISGADVTALHSRSNSHTNDTELPFVPQTPQKPAKPLLGFATPSTSRRHVSGSATATPLPPVSERVGNNDDGSLTRRDSAAWARAERNGLGNSHLRREGEISDAGSRSSSGSSGSSTVKPGAGRREHRHSASASATPSRRVDPSPRTPATPALNSSTRPHIPRATSHQSVSVDGSSLARRPSRSSKPPQTATPDTPLDHVRMRSSRTQSSLASLGSSAPAAGVPQRSRGFPSELTKGAVPTSSPVPLTPSRRVPSESRGSIPSGTVDTTKERSVAEKKAILGQWLGNIDDLTKGVEKVGFLGGAGR